MACNDGRQLTAQDVIDSFEAAGLEVGPYRPLVEDDYKVLPYWPEDGIRFFLPSLEGKHGARIMVFDDEAGQTAVKEFYELLDEIENDPLKTTWVFIQGDILVQIHGQIDEEIALQYESALQSASSK